MQSWPLRPGSAGRLAKAVELVLLQEGLWLGSMLRGFGFLQENRKKAFQKLDLACGFRLGWFEVAGEGMRQGKERLFRCSD